MGEGKERVGRAHAEEAAAGLASCAGGCEAGLIGVPGKGGAVIFGPVGVQGEGLCEPGFDLAKAGVLPARHLAQGGYDKEVEGYQAADGIAGQAEDEAAALCDVGGGEGDGFAGLHADAAVVDGAGVFEERLDKVQIAHGDAAGCEQDIGLIEALPDAGLERFLGVAGDAEVDRFSADGADGRQEHGAVAVADLAGSEWLAGLDQLVAGGKDSYFGTGEDGDVDDAGGGEQADLGRVETFSGGQNGLAGLHVDTYWAHVVAGLNLLVDANQGGISVGLQPFRFLDHDDGVGPCGQGRAGCDVGDGAGFEGEVGHSAGANLADERIGARSVGGDYGVAVFG